MAAPGFGQALLAFAAYVLVVLAGLRIATRIEPALLAVVAAFAVCVVALPALAVLGGFNFWLFMVSYWFLATCFLMAFGAVYKSLSLRILADLLAKPGCSDDYQLIFSRYLVEESYQNRLAVLREKGLVALSNDRYKLTQRGRALTCNVHRAQLWFGILRSG